jgi:EAL domain-containing protein (putative c-di-GMP-specific phosphodiesterase class I)
VVPVLDKIGIVDDDPVFAAIAEMLLFSLGQKHVAMVQNSPDAIARFALEGTGNSLLITSLTMHSMDGLSVLRELAKSGYTGWVAISGNGIGMVSDAASRLALLLGMGFAGSLPKPVHEQDLQTVLQRVAQDSLYGGGLPVAPPSTKAFVGLKPVYQPKLDAKTGETVGAEALMRLELEDGSLTPPIAHLEQLSNKGLLAAESLKFLDLILADMIGWKARGLFPVISFNAPAPVVEKPAFLMDFARKVRAAGISPSQITVELTENVLPSDLATLIETLTRLRIAGYGLALDDFGTGMANFDILRMCPFSELKIDRSLAQASVTDPLSCGVIETCATVSRELGMTLTAEGVETEEQEVTLRRLGVQLFQGYLFGHGVIASDFAERFGSEQAALAQGTAFAGKH